MRELEVSTWEAAWQPVVDAVGTDFGDATPVVGPDAVEAGAVRRFCEALEFDCPLHHDVQLARSLGYGDVVAPVSSLVCFTIQPMWLPGEPPIFEQADADAQPTRTSIGPKSTGLEPASPAYFATDMAAEYLEPVVVGDRLSRVGNRLVSCVPKETRVGRGAFMTWESEVRNQHDRVVARLRNGTYRYAPRPGAAPAHAAPPAPNGRAFPAGPMLPSYAPVDWSARRRWDDISEGEEVGAVAFPLSIYRLVVEAGANRDFNAIHHNREWARSTGAPDMYANAVFLQGMWERCVREFIGVEGTVRAIAGFRMGSFNIAGDTVVVGGSVRRKWLESGTGFLELEIRSENSLGVSVGPGTVTVTVPAA
jgi:acyl dehydratase